jgi:hypothetical protein
LIGLPAASTLLNSRPTGFWRFASVPVMCWPLLPSSNSSSKSAFVGELVLSMPESLAAPIFSETDDVAGTGV